MPLPVPDAYAPPNLTVENTFMLKVVRVSKRRRSRLLDTLLTTRFDIGAMRLGSGRVVAIGRASACDRATTQATGNMKQIVGR